MQILEKRTSESKKFDVDCSLLLGASETVSTVTTITGTPTLTTPLVFGAGAVNASPTTYTDAFGSTRVAAIGKAIQFNISGGSIASGAQVQDCIVRVVFATNLNAAVEATVKLRLNDTP